MSRVPLCWRTSTVSVTWRSRLGHSVTLPTCAPVVDSAGRGLLSFEVDERELTLVQQRELTVFGRRRCRDDGAADDSRCFGQVGNRPRQTREGLGQGAAFEPVRFETIRDHRAHVRDLFEQSPDTRRVVDNRIAKQVDCVLGRLLLALALLLILRQAQLDQRHRVRQHRPGAHVGRGHLLADGRDCL